MILKRGVAIGLGEIPGIAGLREEAKVRKIEALDLFPLHMERFFGLSIPVEGMCKHKPQEEDHHGEVNEKKIGSPHFFFSIRIIFLRSRIIFVSWYISS